MKAVLHIIGIGNNTLGKLSLDSYRLLKAATCIYVLDAGHPAVREMLDEGMPCRVLSAAMDGMDGRPIARAILAQHQTLEPGGSSLVLALPGNPIPEGGMISSITAELSAYFAIDTSLLAAEDSLQKLAAIMAELRSERGCPWDKEQDHQSLKKYLIEETYEVIDAIDAKDMNNFCEELGDLLLQIVFHARIAEESGIFSLGDVIRGICDKLIRRHPHVFGSVRAETSQEVLLNWDKIKKQEKATDLHETQEQDYFRIPKGLPALLMAEETQKKAAKIGFDWDSCQGPLAKVYEELGELEKEIGHGQRQREELGDLLFSIVNLARFLQLNPEEVLREGTKKFQARFVQMLALMDREGVDREKLSLKEMDFYWDMAKNSEKNGMNGSF